MASFEIKAYKCEWCGQVFEHEGYHDLECKYDPKARTCVSCLYSSELKADYQKKEATGVYCPRKDEVFIYPHEKYCCEYKKNPHFESYRKNENQV